MNSHDKIEDKNIVKTKDKTMDANVRTPRVAKVMTFKAGKVALSHNFSPEAIQDSRVRFESLYDVLKDMPILPNLADHLDRDLIRRSIFGTAAIEGNPLSEERVAEILAEPPTAHRERADQEIENLAQAYARFTATPADKSRAPLRVSEDLIREINRTVTDHITVEQHTPGAYRNIPVTVGDAAHGGAFKPPKALDDIRTLMGAFVEWINSDEVRSEGPLVRAFLAHYHLAFIHPFCDGNGRTARLLEAAILMQSGYRYIPQTLSNFYYTHIDDYYEAFRKTEKSPDNDVTPFLAFCFRMLVLSVEDVQQCVHWHIRILALKDFYGFSLERRIISRRQHDLLQILLRRGDKPFAQRELFLDPMFTPLYRTVSERTAARDLERLEKERFLLAEDGKYLLNPFTLGT
jgi:Fic family protein